MGYKVRSTKQFDKQFAKLDKSVKKQILDWLDEHIEDNPNPRHTGKALQGNLKGYWRYRIGNYRIICDIIDKELVVLGLQVGHRKQIYKLKR